jgi:hypothetical protein
MENTAGLQADAKCEENSFEAKCQMFLSGRKVAQKQGSIVGLVF